MPPSPFLDVPASEWVAANDLAFAIRDRYPVSEGHTLVIPRRLVATWFDASRAEQQALLDLVDEVKAQLDRELKPDGYNVGFNAGEAAGQTVMHLHVHVIPRFRGDMHDPRGGVRHVIPSKGNYLREARPLATGGRDDPFARHVLPLLERARQVGIVSAFIQSSGLRRIDSALETALQGGAHVRLITGDYLNITQASALQTLLDWQRTWREPEDDDEASEPIGTFEARVIEVEGLSGRVRTFHPKSWHLEGDGFAVAFVGSSNLSQAALESGIEWNLRVERDRDADAWDRVRAAFEALWARARVLDEPWVDAYAARARRSQLPLPPGELDADALPQVFDPHKVQQAALDSLRDTREQGRRRALVVLATGLGKTWLAAFDYGQLWDELGRPPRLLFVAHRREILRQAAGTYRTLARQRADHLRVGWFLEAHADLTADLVFASVAKLSRPAWLARLREQQFDYVVIDEVHHAAASSYRKILAAIDPMFLLGLTATPDRADAADILGLFDDHVAHRADIREGIEIGRLVPFRYFGLKDQVDYKSIPWRNRRFDPEQLAAAVQTEQRMATLWKAWKEHPGARTLVFCCSVAHASFVCDWLGKKDVRVAKVYAAPGSDDRDEALAQLGRGEIDAICAIDVFNEGVDVPALDRVVMLRPTESGVVFLQQLGRGLRAADDKEALTVIDFVGNHRVFLERLRRLLSLGGAASANALRELLSDKPVELPAGCSIDVELEAKQMLEKLFQVGGADEVERAYRELRATREARPTPGELLRMGYNPRAIKDRHGSWFSFVRAEGDLDDAEQAVLSIADAFLSGLEVEAMSKSFKMVTLEALIEADALTTGMDVEELALRSWSLLRRSPELLADVPENQHLPEAPSDAEVRRWVSYWRTNPIAAWTRKKKKLRTWFRVASDRFELDLELDPELTLPFSGLVGELTDYRLAQYRRRATATPSEGFVCKVLWNQRDPILKLPRRSVPNIPEGEVDVRLADGSVWMFRFAKEFCNVARPPGQQRNQLPDLLRRWFGPRAGQPGTAFQVKFTASPDGLWVEPVQSNVIELAARRGIVAYPDLRAAAGHAIVDDVAPEQEVVLLPVENPNPELFAVRVTGSSMDGGRTPLRDGDWAVFRLARGVPADAFENRVTLVQLPGESVGSRFQIKRLVRSDGRWRLTSDNPDGPSFDVDGDMVPVARLDRAVRPEDLAPSVGSRIGEHELAGAFGLDELAPRSGRYGGHLFVFVSQKGQLMAVDRVASPMTLRAGETAYVLAKTSDGWRYLGAGRRGPDEIGLAIPEVDFETWRTWGTSKTVSRPLPDGALARAQQLVDALLAMPEAERALERSGHRHARVLGRAQKGGIRIDGGPDGFAARSVSLTDIAWVAVASDDVRAQGGLLDESRVNRLRYLEGTPKGSTRWIDTGWAIAAWEAGAALAGVLDPRGPGAPHKPRRADGSEVDATFRLERRGDRTTIVFEARGGKKGTPQARNTEYAEGLRLILERLGHAGLELADAAVETRTTAELPLDERRLDLGRPYPVAVSAPDELRRLITSAQERVGRAPGARGGNGTKRIRLWLSADGAAELDSVAQMLTED